MQYVGMRSKKTVGRNIEVVSTKIALRKTCILVVPIVMRPRPATPSYNRLRGVDRIQRRSSDSSSGTESLSRQVQ